MQETRLSESDPCYTLDMVVVPTKRLWRRNEESPHDDVQSIAEEMTTFMANSTRTDGDIQKVPLTPLVFTTNSDVFRCTLETKCVVFKLRRRTIHEPSADSLFCRELKTWKPLKHKNILSLLGVYACFPKLDQIALVSEFQKKGTLVPYVHTQPDVSPIRLLLDVAEGLRYLHSQKDPIIHGDIRGANIAVSEGGQAMIFDFGCACTEEEARQATEFDGTIRWMPAEKIDPSRGVIVNQKSDIYCYGCLCIEVFTGEKPFAHIAFDCTVMFMILQNEPPIHSRPVGQHAAELTDSLWKTIESCWELEPSKRPSSTDICQLLALISTGETQAKH